MSENVIDFDVLGGSKDTPPTDKENLICNGGRGWEGGGYDIGMGRLFWSHFLPQILVKDLNYSHEEGIFTGHCKKKKIINDREFMFFCPLQ